MSSQIKKIVCAISGGIDSCVAALLLKKQGYQVHGVFMRNWDIANETGYCQADVDKADAEYVCKKINIPFTEVNFVKEYWNNVFSNLIQEYKQGLTPNPDILCNKLIKFDAFLKHAINRLGADAVATGHYARVITDGKKRNLLQDLNQHLNINFNHRGFIGSLTIPKIYSCTFRDFHLLKGVDEHKDQTFFLSQIPKSALEKCIFPLGEMTKNAVKTIAAAEGFNRILQRKESMGICFIGRRRFQEFIEEYIESKPGNFINVENNQVVGQHKGVHCWTVGQRCMIGGQPTAYYVAERNNITQDILVAPGMTHPALYHQTVVTEVPYWINPPPVNLESEPFMCDFRFQHREPTVKCLLYKDNEGRLQIFLKDPLRAVTPGQYAVFYTDEECLGSAKILFRGPSMYHIKSVMNKRVS